MELTINNRKLDIEFEGSMQGFRLDVHEWVNDEYLPIEGFTWQIQRLMQTQFEALMDLSSYLFDEAVHAETMAQKLGIPMNFYED